MANIGYIQVTRHCNQRCIICSNPPNPREMELETAKRLIKELKEQGAIAVIFTGGEPTLYPHLPEVIQHANGVGIEPRIITNGQLLADSNYAKTLWDAGLRHVHLSIYSCREEVHGLISQKKDSLPRALEALENLGRLGIRVDITIAITHYNAGHLDETTFRLTKRFPFIRHFVYNFLDPLDNRASEHPEAIPHLWEPEVPLYKAMIYLEKTGRTFRVERYPACYMAEFAWANTEVRKKVLEEERDTYFLDEKGHVHQEDWVYGKAEACKYCTFSEICPGLWDMDGHYSSSELFPVFVPVRPIIERIRKRA